MKKEVKKMIRKILFGMVFGVGVIAGSSGNVFSDAGSGTNYNSTTVQEFANVPSTGANSWCSNVIATYAPYGLDVSTGFTIYADRFVQPNFGRNLVVGTTFNCFDNFIATSIINGYALVRGTDTMGRVMESSITFQANSRGVGDVAYIYISSFTVHFTSISCITPIYFRVEVGDGLYLGLNSYFETAPLYILENEVRTTSATFNQKYSTFKPRGAQNGTNDFKVNYPALRRY